MQYIRKAAMSFLAEPAAPNFTDSYTAVTHQEVEVERLFEVPHATRFAKACNPVARRSWSRCYMHRDAHASTFYVRSVLWPHSPLHMLRPATDAYIGFCVIRIANTTDASVAWWGRPRLGHAAAICRGRLWRRLQVQHFDLRSSPCLALAEHVLPADWLMQEAGVCVRERERVRV